MCPFQGSLEYGISSNFVKPTTDNVSKYVKAFEVFAPSEDELEVSTTGVRKILNN